MMAVAPYLYGRFLESLVEGRVNVVADDMYCMLVGAGYTFSQDAHKFKSVITGEISGSGYESGGQQVTTSSPAYDSSLNLLKIPAGNVVWPIVTFTGAKGAVLYMNPDGFPDSAKPLVGYIDFGSTISRADTAFYINWAATGVVRLDVP